MSALASLPACIGSAAGLCIWHGFDALRTLARDAPTHLVPGGWLLLEHGWDQGAAVRGLLRDAGFQRIETLRDLEDRERVTLGSRAPGG